MNHLMMYIYPFFYNLLPKCNSDSCTRLASDSFTAHIMAQLAGSLPGKESPLNKMSYLVRSHRLIRSARQSQKCMQIRREAIDVQRPLQV
jgi:hypothetical protein